MKKILETKRQESTRVRMLVQQILDWDDLKYNSFQEEMGLAYLAHHYGDAPLVDRIPEHREFWGWWRQHWTRRELDFLDIQSLLFANEKEEYYRDLHNPEQISHTPHSIILDNTYERMMHNLVRNATRRKEVHNG